MPKHGKRYREQYAKVDRERAYAPAEAVRLIKQTQSAKFAETVEAHIRTGLNVRHADEQLRGTITLPHSAGRDVTIAVFARGAKADEAREAGADIVGDEDLAKRIQEDGFTDFDVAIATPDVMGQVGRLGRVLGPRGLLDQDRRRRGLGDERERAVLEDRDLDRDDAAVLVLRLGVERLAELHDVHAVLAERRADGRSRIRGPAGHLQLDECQNLLGHLPSA